MMISILKSLMRIKVLVEDDSEVLAATTHIEKLTAEIRNAIKLIDEGKGLGAKRKLEALLK